MRISVSQMKKFHGNKATRVGEYVLGIRENVEKDVFTLGSMFEERLLDENFNKTKYLKDKNIYDKIKFDKDFEALKHNAEGLKFEKGELQHKVEGKLFGVNILGYIDNLTDEWIDDVKTTAYLTKLDTDTVSQYNGLTKMEEYELQLRVYMKLLNRNKARIIEIGKHKYKDGRKSHQIIEFHRDKEMDKRMKAKREPIVKEMVKLDKQFSIKDNSIKL